MALRKKKRAQISKIKKGNLQTKRTIYNQTIRALREYIIPLK